MAHLSYRGSGLVQRCLVRPSVEHALTRAAITDTQQAALVEAVLEMEKLSSSKRLAELLRPR